MEIKQDTEFIKLCKEVIADYVSKRIDKTGNVKISTDDVYVVWSCKTLQNWKALVSTTLPNGMYFEITHNGDKNETYIDVYKKRDNFVVKQKGQMNMDFGQAIEEVKRGKKIARKGWNGKEQYVELATNVSYKSPNGTVTNVDHKDMGNKALAFVGTSCVQLGWLASQADMLSEDWQTID